MASTQPGWLTLWSTANSAVDYAMGAPACGAGAVYVASGNTVVAFNYETGETIWTWTTPTSQGVTAAPQLYGNTIITTSNTYGGTQSIVCWIDAETVKPCALRTFNGRGN